MTKKKEENVENNIVNEYKNGNNYNDNNKEKKQETRTMIEIRAKYITTTTTTPVFQLRVTILSLRIFFHLFHLNE